MKKIFVVLISIFFSGFAFAQENKKTFQHKDWELACDNTGTCRAAGYQPEATDDSRIPLPASLYIERAAGAATKVKMSIAIYNPEDEKGFQFPTEFSIDGKYFKKIGKLASDSYQSSINLNVQVVDRLIELLPNSKNIHLRSNKLKWDISLEGVKAVLTKMDEWQGRVGTTGALIAKGKNDESNVSKAIPMPIITVPKLVGTSKTDEKLILTLSKLVKKEECEGGGWGNVEMQISDFGVTRLDASTLLLFNFNCYRGAYNQGGLAWLIKDIKPYVLQPVEQSDFNDYSNGILFLSHKGRGIGDCWANHLWVWNGEGFVPAKITTSGMCKGFPGGAWDMPTYMSKVINLNVKKEAKK